MSTAATNSVLSAKYSHLELTAECSDYGILPFEAFLFSFTISTSLRLSTRFYICVESPSKGQYLVMERYHFCNNFKYIVLLVIVQA